MKEEGKCKNTVKATSWAVNVFSEWREARNNQPVIPGERFTVVPPLTAFITDEQLDFWLSRFVVEVCKTDGLPYPGSSLKLLVAGIQRHLREECNKTGLSLFDDAQFGHFRSVLDGRMKLLSREGVGILRKQAEPLSVAQEEELWEKGVFNTHTSRGLQNIVYFYNCKVFGLRASDEHSNLKVDQFIFGEDEAGHFVRFVGRPNKTNQGGLKECGKLKYKDVKQYEQTGNSRCFVKILKQYLAAVPKQGPFYRRPLAATAKQQIRFSQQKVGLHTFEQMLQRMCSEAGIEGRFTGHSGKVNIYVK